MNSCNFFLLPDWKIHQKFQLLARYRSIPFEFVTTFVILVTNKLVRHRRSNVTPAFSLLFASLIYINSSHLYDSLILFLYLLLLSFHEIFLERKYGRDLTAEWDFLRFSHCSLECYRNEWVRVRLCGSHRSSFTVGCYFLACFCFQYSCRRRSIFWVRFHKFPFWFRIVSRVWNIQKPRIL